MHVCWCYFSFFYFYLLKGQQEGRKEQPVWCPRAGCKGHMSYFHSSLGSFSYLSFLFFLNKISWANIEFPGIQDVFPSPKFHWADSKKRERNPYRAKENKAHVWKFQIVLITQEIAFWQPQERVTQYIGDYILREKQISLSYIQCLLRVNRWSYCFALVTSKF